MQNTNTRMYLNSQSTGYFSFSSEMTSVELCYQYYIWVITHAKGAGLTRSHLRVAGFHRFFRAARVRMDSLYDFI